MTRFNTPKKQQPKAAAPIVSTPSPTARTYNNAPGYVRDVKSELFLLAVANFVSQDTFYEDANRRDGRYVQLIRQSAVEDPKWTHALLKWLRLTANMRTASVIGGVEAAIALATTGGGGRALLADCLQRADEPGEALAYYMTTYGRNIPQPIKRGVADAVKRLYTERNTLKYDTDSKGLRFGDVLEICHPKPGRWDQGILFKHLITRGKGRTEVIPDELTMLVANAALRQQAAATPEVLLNPTRLNMAGMTWEDVLSLAGSKIDKKDLWEAIIPNMGYMALARNLRNFDQAGISKTSADYVTSFLTNPEFVKASRQLPLRFLSAYRELPSDRWKWPLDQALQMSLSGVPSFTGRTLILIDTSGSMDSPFSRNGKLRLFDAAAMFGLALAQRCEDSTVVSYSNSSREFPAISGESLLRSLDRFLGSYLYRLATATAFALRKHYAGHDRVVILTDEQADYDARVDVTRSVPANIPVITFNLAGYQVGHAPSGTANRFTIGGLSDAAFQLLPALEQRGRGLWPF